MKWMIIVLIMLSLIGSMMWVMPTPRQKYQAALRLQAKKMGFRVQLERITPPRAKGEMEAEATNITTYRLSRGKISRQARESLPPWTAFRIESVANIGLPAGWSWSQGERTLSEQQLALIHEVIAELPGDVLAIESSPVEVGVYWGEEGGEAALEQIKTQLQRLVEAHV